MKWQNKWNMHKSAVLGFLALKNKWIMNCINLLSSNSLENILLELVMQIPEFVKQF